VIAWLLAAALSLTVTPRGFAFAPAEVRARVSVDVPPTGRTLAIALVSSDHEQAQRDPDRAARSAADGLDRAVASRARRRLPDRRRRPRPGAADPRAHTDDRAHQTRDSETEITNESQSHLGRRRRAARRRDAGGAGGRAGSHRRRRSKRRPTCSAPAST
jgi:hypothetical protein